MPCGVRNCVATELVLQNPCFCPQILLQMQIPSLHPKEGMIEWVTRRDNYHSLESQRAKTSLLYQLSEQIHKLKSSNRLIHLMVVINDSNSCHSPNHQNKHSLGQIYNSHIHSIYIGPTSWGS